MAIAQLPIGAAASLNNHHCPHCASGLLRLQKARPFETTIGGRAVTIPDARLNACQQCGGEVVSEEEWLRWEALTAKEGA